MAVLKRLLAACATDVSGPEDDAVVDYCENLIQVFIETRSIDDEPAEPAALYEAVQPFLDPESSIGCSAFVAALEQVSHQKKDAASEHASADEAQIEGSAPESQTASARAHQTLEHADETKPKFVHCAQPNRGGTMDEKAGGERARASSGARGDAVVGRNHKRLEDLVADALLSANPGSSSVDPTVVDYICSVLRDGLDEEDASELFDGIVGVAPELEQCLSGVFDVFLARACDLIGQEKQSRRQQAGASALQGCAHGAEQSSGHDKIQFTLRANRPFDGEEFEEDADEASEEEQLHEVITSPRHAQLREIFPDRPLEDLRTVLELTQGKVDEAIDKMFSIQEFESMSISQAEVSAQHKAELEAFREATRVRALTRYDKVASEEVEEKGKGTVARPLLRKDESIDKTVAELRKGGRKRDEIRYLDNAIVARKGERFLYTKTKNAAEEDPKTFVGLKIVTKRKGGPSPNFK